MVKKTIKRNINRSIYIPIIRQNYKIPKYFKLDKVVSINKQIGNKYTKNFNIYVGIALIDFSSFLEKNGCILLIKIKPINPHAKVYKMLIRPFKLKKSYV